MDFSKTGEELVTELFNTANPDINIPRSALTFSAAAANDGADAAQRNTKLTLTAVAGSGFTGTALITYNRLVLSVVAVGAGAAFEVLESDVNVSDVIGRFNTRHKTDLKVGVDYTDAVLPVVAPGESENYVFTPLPASKVYQGSVTLVLSVPAVDIGTAETQLDGFDIADAE